jgi:hypothetical protein
MPALIKRRVLLLGVAANWLAATRGHAAEPAGAVETARGECYALNAASRRTLASAAEIFINDAVATGVQSALALRLGLATQVKLGAETRLRIDRFVVNAGGVLVLEHGAMLYDHEAEAGKDPVTVRSPYGLVAVRGTRFFAGPSNGVFGVFVERGEVTVVGVQTAVVVQSGYGTNIAVPGAEPTLPTAWGASRIASAMASVQ